MKRLQGLIVSVMVLGLAFTSMESVAAAPVSGAKCTKVGTSVAAGKWLFTCTKSTRGPRWKRTILPLDYGITVTPTSGLLPTDACRIQDVSMGADTWRTSSGWNRPAWTVPATSPVRMLVLPVSFPDATFGSAELSFVKGGYEFADELFRKASAGASGLDITYAPRDKWVSLPSTAASWNLDPGPYGEGNATMQVDTWSLTRTVLDAADPSLGLQNYPVVAVVAPVSGVMTLTNRTEALPAFMYTTPSGALVRGATFGTANVSKESVAHELGHAWLGFEDLYGPIRRLGQAPDPDYPNGWFPRWDLMSDNSDLSSWSRFVLGWLPPSQVRCASPTASTTHSLQMLSEPGSKPKSVVIPLSTSRALVVESRTITQYTSYASGPTVVVYDVNTEFNHHDGPFRQLAEITQASPVKSVTLGGVTIAVQRQGPSGAVISVN